MRQGGIVAPRRRLVLAASAGFAIAAALAATVWLGVSAPSRQQSSPARTSAQVKARSAQARHVAAALRRLATDPQSLVASGARTQVDGRARQAVPAGSVVVPDARSWAPDGLGGGTMLVTITAPGQAPVRYYAVMVREAGHWKVLATIRVPARAPTSPGSAS